MRTFYLAIVGGGGPVNLVLLGDMTTAPERSPTFAVVRAFINGWDPYGLIESGSAADEYHAEITILVAWVPRINSVDDATTAVAEAFASAYADEEKRRQVFRDAGTTIYNNLRKNGLLGPTPGE